MGLVKLELRVVTVEKTSNLFYYYGRGSKSSPNIQKSEESSDIMSIFMRLFSGLILRTFTWSQYQLPCLLR